MASEVGRVDLSLRLRVEDRLLLLDLRLAGAVIPDRYLEAASELEDDDEVGVGAAPGLR